MKKHPLIRTVLVPVLIILAANVSIEMIGQGMHPSAYAWKLAILDSLLLVIIAIPVIYIFMMRPLNEQLKLSKDTERRYGALLEGLGDEYFIYMHDVSGVFKYVSPSVSKVLGYAPDEIFKHYSHFLTDNPVNRKVREYTASSLMGTAQPSYRVEIYHKNGSKMWLSVTERPVYDSSGDVIGVEGVAHDITRMKAVEDEKQKKIDELEDFFRITMDREKRIADLKSEVETLKRAISGGKAAT